MTEHITPPNDDRSDLGRTQSVPDPTLLTIDALRREIAMLENLIMTKIEAEADLSVERFHRIDEGMATAENQRREQKADTKAAVEAALESQKEATTKMETTVSDQIASLRVNFETAISGVRSSLSDLKDRMTIVESLKQGAVEQKTETRQITAGQIAVIGIGITFLLAVITVVSFILGGG